MDKKPQQFDIASSPALVRAFDEIRLLNVPIDSIIQGYIDYWSEVDNSIEGWMDFQKRVYILAIRYLPNTTHRDIYMQVIKEYRVITKENKLVLNRLKQRKKLENEDIAMFDNWVSKDANILDETVSVPILEEYQNFMKGVLPTGTCCASTVHDLGEPNE